MASFGHSLILALSLLWYISISNSDARGQHSGTFCYNLYDLDKYEPDDSYFEATLLESGIPSTNHSLTCDDTDWFKFELTALSNGIILETTSIYEYTTADTKMYLYSDSLNCIDYNDDKDLANGVLTSYIELSCNKTYERLPNGTYYVKIIGYGINTQYKQYDMKLTVDECGKGQDINYPTCDNVTELTINWENLISNDDTSQIYRNIDVYIAQENVNYTNNTGSSSDDDSSKPSSVTVDVTVTASYVVSGIYPTLTEDTLGVTYILDTDLFDGSSRELWDANNCENRMKSSFKSSNENHTDLIGFYDYWNYTLQPSNPNELGSNEYLEYPPSNWFLSFITNNESKTCNGYVKWTQSFSLDDLVDCGGFNWDSPDDSDYIELKGVFYLVVASPDPVPPFDNDDQDWTNYLTKTLLTQTILIKIGKIISIMDNSYVQLSNSIITNVNFYENYFSGENTTDDGLSYFEVGVLTYVPEWMYLNPTGDDNKLLSPSILDLIDLNTNINDSYFDSIAVYEDRSGYSSDTDTCLYEDDTRCWQRWTVLIVMKDNFKCQDNEGSSADDVSFDGDYQLQFNYICDNYTSSYCIDFENQLEILGVITFDEMELSYTETCDITVSEFEYQGSLSFYETEDYTEQIDPDKTLYDVGEMIYLEAKILALNDSSLSVLGMEIDSVYLCTASNEDINNIGGTVESCDDLKNINGAYWYDVINDGDEDGQATYPYSDNYNENSNYKKKFSFKIPVIAESKFYVETNVLLTVNDGTTTRRLLLSDNTNSFETFFNGGSITSDSSGNNNNDNTGTIVGIVIGIILFVLIIVGVVVFVRYRQKQQTAEKQYQKL